MSAYIKEAVAKNAPHFRKYEKYIRDNDWTKLKGFKVEDGEKKPKDFKTDVDVRKEEFNVQEELVKVMLIRLKNFAKKSLGDHHLAIFKKFVKEALSIIAIHTERAEDYITNSDLSGIDKDLKASEIAFHNHLYKTVSSTEEAVLALNIKEEEARTDGIEFLNNIKAPLSMHKVLSEIYPEINIALKNKKIDFESEPNNELHILNPNPPKWNTDKHYFEQETSTLQYYVDEFKKLETGVVVDGYYISGWMYYHMNVFVTPIPQKVLNNKSGMYESKDIIMNPPLRDSDVIIFENHELQKKGNKLFMFIAATRRMAKTTLESSKIGHAVTIGKKEILCAGGSAKDLGQITKNFKTDLQYKNEAFSVFNISNDWKDKVQIGLKTKLNKTILLSTVNIVNTDSGNNVEILAGYTPDEFLYDEAMKGKFLEALQGLKPALRGAEGLIRCFGILSSTGGDEALSKDGHTLLNDPDAYDVLPMQWNLLERGVDLEYQTWDDDRRPFGTFVPGQMCVDMPKFESNLADYVGMENCPNLSKIKLKITDWKLATERIEGARNKLIGNRLAYMKEVTYIPLKPSDVVLSGKISPFPVAEAKSHRDYLITSGLWDRRRELYRDTNGEIKSEISTKDIIEYPHKGGIKSAPFLIFEDLPTEKPRYGTYAGSFDDYATDDSETNSVATFYVVKNKVLGDPFSEKIVASLSIRPGRHQEVYEKWLMLMEIYNLEQTTFGENFNYAIKDYLDKKHLADKYLAPSLDFTQSFNLPNNLKRKTGFTPSAPVKKHIFDLFVDYCNQEFEAEQEDGKIINIKGVQRIDDVELLEEIIQYTEHSNVDRIISASAAVAYIHYLQSSHRWKVKNYEQVKQVKDVKRQPQREKSFYGGSSRQKSFYRKH